MNIPSFVAALFYIGLTVSGGLALGQNLIMTVRGGESLLEAHCSKGHCGKAIQSNNTIEFANGNTFVRLEENLSGKNILLIVPERLSSNQFIELLIKVRTSKKEFAQRVRVITPSARPIIVLDESNTKVLSPELTLELMREAGVDTLNKRQIPKDRFNKVRQARKFVVVHDGGNIPLAEKVAAELSLPLFKFQQFLREKTHIDATGVIFISSLGKPHNTSFLRSLDEVHQIRKRHLQVTLVTPYLPYARSDKKDQAGVTITGRLAADMIERSGANSVQFVRAHAPQSEGFFRIPTIQTMGRSTINTHLRAQKIQQVISPDAGFQKDATLYAEDLGLPISVINKQRELKTGESQIHDMSGPEVKGKIVAIIDDETASGGTLDKAAKFLKGLGAKKVIAVVTHLAGSALQALNSPDVDSMAVTDTFDVSTTQNPKLKVLSIARELSHDLRRMVQVSPRCSQTYGD